MSRTVPTHRGALYALMFGAALMLIFFVVTVLLMPSVSLRRAKADDAIAQRGLSAQDVLDARGRPPVDVHEEAARLGCTIVLRDGYSVVNTSIYDVRIVTAPGAEELAFGGNEITGARP